MGLYQVLLLLLIVTLSAVPLAHSEDISSDSKHVEMSPPSAPISSVHQLNQQNSGTTRLLRGSEEERQISAGNAVGMFASAAKNKVQLKLYLSLGLKPETVMKLMKVTSRDHKNFKRYSKYFFQYYVKYLNAPLSHLPASTVDDIMNARLQSFLAGPLTPPQVKEIIGDGKYLKRYTDMWTNLQVRESNRINRFSAEAPTLNGRDWTAHTRIEA